MPTIEGIYAAPFTPFCNDYSINWDTIDEIAARLIRFQIAGVFINGTTGEFASLTLNERKKLTEKWKTAVNGKLKVIVHVGSTCIQDSQDLSRHAYEVGVDGFSTVPPFYFKPANLDALIQSSAMVASAVPELPFYYYHIPSCTGVSFPMSDYLNQASSQIPNLSGVKYSHSDLTDVHGCLTACGSRFTVFFGVDEMYLGAMAMGVKAAVGSTYNLAAPVYQSIIKAFQNGDMETARMQQTKITAMIRVINQYGGLPALKAIMELTGTHCGPLRLPLRTLTANEKDTLRRDLDRIGFFESNP